jgi:sensor histidine kinase YesM
MAYRRSIFLINRPFQLRFSLYVCSWIVALSFIYPLIVAYIFDYFVRYAAMDPMGPSMKLLRETRSEVIWLLILIQVTFLSASFLMSLFMSHRIAGPLYNLTKSFSLLKEGIPPEQIRFRKKDHFKDLAAEYNEVVETLVKNYESTIAKLSDSILKLEKAAESATDPELKKRIEETLGDLRQTREKIPH